MVSKGRMTAGLGRLLVVLPAMTGYSDLVGPWHASALIVDDIAVLIGTGRNIVACDLTAGIERWSRSADDPRHPSKELDVVNCGVMMAFSADRLVTRGWKNLVCYRAQGEVRP